MKAGDKVVCVDDEGQSHASIKGGDAVKKGLVYVVREVVPDPWHVKPDNYGYGLRLIGLHGGIWIRFGEEATYHPRRFRLVAEVGHPPVAIQKPEALPA